MNLKNRRLKARDTVNNTTNYIEIFHSFGTRKKTVYKIAELHDQGFSFLVPARFGYFYEGTPLKFSLKINKHDNPVQIGIVRYYYRYDDNFNEKYYKIGVQITPSMRDVSSNSYQLRPKRYNSEISVSKSQVNFIINNKEVSYFLKDISKFSAAFFVPSKDIENIRISSILNPFKVMISGNVIYQGAVVISNIQEMKSKKSKVVVEPRKKIFNIDLIEKHEEVDSKTNLCKNIIQTHNMYSNVDDKFKAVLADLRFFLEDLKKNLDLPEFQDDFNNDPNLLNALHSVFFPIMETYVIKVDKIVNTLKLDNDNYSIYKRYFQSQINHLVLAAPFCFRMLNKPLGYPGDFKMMQMIKENQFQGPSIFSKLINKHALGNALAQGNRLRIKFLCDKLVDISTLIKKDKVDVLSIASGPAFELGRLIKHHKAASDRLNITLLDQEIEALKFSQEHLYEKKISYESNITFNFIHKTIVGLIKETKRKKTSVKKYDIVYIFGLFDYFNDKLCNSFLRSLQVLVNPGGSMLVSNYSLEGHQHRCFIELAYEWYMQYRNKKDMKNMIQGISNIEKYYIEEEKTKTIKFLHIKFK